MDIPTPHEALEIDDDENIIAWMGELATLHATKDGRDSDLAQKALTFSHDQFHGRLDTFIASLRHVDPTDMGWRNEFRRECSRLPQARLDMFLADNCIQSDLIEEEALAGGIFMRRLDALLDLADSPFSAADIQGYYGQLVSELAEAKLNWVHSTGASAIGGAAGFAGGWFFMPGLGMKAGEIGSQLFLEAASGSDDTVEGAARIVLWAVAALESSKPDVDSAMRLHSTLESLALKASDRLSRQRTRSSNVYTGEGAHLDRAARVLGAAAQFLRQMIEEAKPGALSQVTMPNVVGHMLSSAHELLIGMGFDVTIKDAQDRMIMNKANWRVVRQTPSPGFPKGSVTGSVTLHVAKYGEPAPSAPRAAQKPAPRPTGPAEWDYERVIRGLGGRDNVTSLSPDDTRIIVAVRDQSAVDGLAVSLAGVPAVTFRGDGVQLVVGFKARASSRELARHLAWESGDGDHEGVQQQLPPRRAAAAAVESCRVVYDGPE